MFILTKYTDKREGCDKITKNIEGLLNHINSDELERVTWYLWQQIWVFLESTNKQILDIKNRWIIMGSNVKKFLKLWNYRWTFISSLLIMYFILPFYFLMS